MSKISHDSLRKYTPSPLYFEYFIAIEYNINYTQLPLHCILRLYMYIYTYKYTDNILRKIWGSNLRDTNN